MQNILIVIDMQNDFIDGALGTPEAQAIVEKVKEKIRSYAGKMVFATMDTHHSNYLDTLEGKHLPVEHCIQNTKGWELHPDIKELLTEADAKIYKKDGFGSEQLATALKALSYMTKLSAEIVGLCTDICVVSNALMLKSMVPEIEITVDASCCAGVTPKKHAAALETMRSCQISVING